MKEYEIESYFLLNEKEYSALYAELIEKSLKILIEDVTDLKKYICEAYIIFICFFQQMKTVFVEKLNCNCFDELTNFF